MTHQPTGTSVISFCITNHDYGAFVGRAVDSALGQEGAPVEVLVVDDGSTDDSLDVLRAYGDRIRLISQPNGGQGAAVNAAFAASSGDVVVFVDADDEVTPGLAAHLAAAFEDPAVTDVQFLGELVDAHGATLGIVLPRKAELLGRGDLRDVVLRHRSWPCQAGGGHAYRRSALEHVMPMPAADYRTAADGYFAETLPLLGRTEVVDHVGFRYRMHGRNDSLSRAVDASYFRTRMDRTVRTGVHVRALAARLGLAVDADPRAPLDPAFLSYELASLRLDPSGHPWPDDRRLPLTWRGVRACLSHPLLSTRSRLVRLAWFLLVGMLPRRAARRVIEGLTPDVPRSTRQNDRQRKTGRKTSAARTSDA